MERPAKCCWPCQGTWFVTSLRFMISRKKPASGPYRPWTLSAVAKIQDAQRVTHYRPINILNLCYRVYSTIWTRQALRFLAAQAPDTLLGMLPYRSAQQVWYAMQLQVETTRMHGGSLCGVLADLRKAFNLIPRLPTLACSLKLGLPIRLVRAWTGALTMVSRRFKVGSCVGPALHSLTGFPAMSCTAMVVLNLAHQQFLKLRARLLTYVDNWELLTQTAPQAIQAYKTMESFTTAWDIELDTSKTQVWSTSSTERARFRSCGLKVVHNMRELGGHLQLTCAMTNATLVNRGRELADLWPKLQSSPSPKSQKSKAIMVSAWPRGLHGVSICRVGSRHFGQPQAAAMKATGNAWPATSAKLHCSMVEFPLLDPAFAALKMTIWDLQVYTTRKEIGPLLDHRLRCVLRRPLAQGWFSWTEGMKLAGLGFQVGTWCKTQSLPSVFGRSLLRSSCTA